MPHWLPPCRLNSNSSPSRLDAQALADQVRRLSELNPVTDTATSPLLDGRYGSGAVRDWDWGEGGSGGERMKVSELLNPAEDTAVSTLMDGRYGAGVEKEREDGGGGGEGTGTTADPSAGCSH